MFSGALELRGEENRGLGMSDFGLGAKGLGFRGLPGEHDAAFPKGRRRRALPAVLEERRCGTSRSGEARG